MRPYSFRSGDPPNIFETLTRDSGEYKYSAQPRRRTLLVVPLLVKIHLRYFSALRRYTCHSRNFHQRITQTLKGKSSLSFDSVTRLTFIQMPPPGSFLGARFDFLQAQRRLYKAALISSSKQECLSDIQRRYFKRFPIEHEHNIDPTPEFLESVNDDEADAEFVAPDPSSMSPEEFKKADQAFKERQKLLTFRKEVSWLDLLSDACHVPQSLFKPFGISRSLTSLSSLQQIARWLKNNHRKTLSTKVREADPEDPITILMARLTGSKLAKPRAPPPYNVWAKQPDIKALVDKEYKLSRPTGRTDCNLLRDIRSRLYNEMVPTTERLHWRKLAMDEGKVAVEEWEQNLVRPPATDPESRQRLVVHVLPLEYTPLT